MSYDMLAFDLDGTTITNTYQMSPSFVELIKEEKKHHYICIATGRSISDAYRYYRLLELETMMICFNGAFIYNPRTKEVLYSRISKNGLFKEHKSVMFEIRLADSPNDTCPMEYEASQEIVTFD